MTDDDLMRCESCWEPTDNPQLCDHFLLCPDCALDHDCPRVHPRLLNWRLA